ncbi:MAG TPA: CHRD domain-containing protein [Longimicrobium sp.]|nr:CHRD domain-containing protein [Longimicrobium sp.]
MRHSIPFAAVACTLALACGEPSTAPQGIDVEVLVTRGETHHFVAAQSGGEEVPANTTKSRGHATFWLSEDGTELRYRLVVANIEGVTQAHIHLAQPGVNGPVVVFLYGFNAAGITTNGILAEGTIVQANLIPRPAIGFGGTMTELVAAMRSGGAYVNTHTLAIPGGQVRGQVHEAGPSS